MEQKCTACNGDGYTAEHGCGGDDRICSHICPVQVQCETCKATGKVGVVAEPTDEELKKAIEIVDKMTDSCDMGCQCSHAKGIEDLSQALSQARQEGRKEGAKKVVEGVTKATTVNL